MLQDLFCTKQIIISFQTPSYVLHTILCIRHYYLPLRHLCFNRVGSRGSERLRILYKITQLINNGTKILTDELYHTGLSLLRMRAELLQSGPSLCDLMDRSVQAPLSMGFSRQETESPCPSPGDLPNPGTEPRSSALQADSLLRSHPGSLLLWRKSLKELAS